MKDSSLISLAAFISISYILVLGFMGLDIKSFADTIPENIVMILTHS